MWFSKKKPSVIINKRKHNREMIKTANDTLVKIGKSKKFGAMESLAQAQVIIEFTWNLKS